MELSKSKSPSDVIWYFVEGLCSIFRCIGISTVVRFSNRIRWEPHTFCTFPELNGWKCFSAKEPVRYLYIFCTTSRNRSIFRMCMTFNRFNIPKMFAMKIVCCAIYWENCQYSGKKALSRWNRISPKVKSVLCNPSIYLTTSGAIQNAVHKFNSWFTE